MVSMVLSGLNLFSCVTLSVRTVPGPGLLIGVAGFLTWFLLASLLFLLFSPVFLNQIMFYNNQSTRIAIAVRLLFLYVHFRYKPPHRAKLEFNSIACYPGSGFWMPRTQGSKPKNNDICFSLEPFVLRHPWFRPPLKRRD